MAKRCKLEGLFSGILKELFLQVSLVLYLVFFLHLNTTGYCATDTLLIDIDADPSGFILFPLVIHSFDLIVSAIGIASIKGTRDPSSKSGVEDPMVILQKGYSVTLFLAVLAFGGVSLSSLKFVPCFKV